MWFFELGGSVFLGSILRVGEGFLNGLGMIFIESDIS